MSERGRQRGFPREDDVDTASAADREPLDRLSLARIREIEGDADMRPVASQTEETF